MTNQNIPVRPLNKGMVRNIPSQSLESGAVLSAGNFNITTNGLEARGGFTPLTTPIENVLDTYNNCFNYISGDVQNTFLYNMKDGQSELLTVTNKALYKIDKDDGTYTRISFSGYFTAESVEIYDTDKIEITQLIADNFVQGYVTLNESDLDEPIQEQLRIDDYITYGEQIGQIYDFDSDDTYYRIRIKVDNPTEWLTASGTMYAELNFQVLPNHKIDHAFVSGVSSNSVVFTANRGRALAYYDNTGVLYVVPIDSTSSVSSVYDVIITDCTVSRWFKDRLWMANTIEDGGVYRQRVRWSDATTYLSYNTAFTFSPENYIDLSDSTGEVLAIYPMGELLVVYCSDAIYYGHQTNLSGLPYTFTKLNTPNIGLVGQSAITPWIDGHYFVAQDEIYFMSSATSLQPIGITVGDLTIDTCYNKAGIDVRPDPDNSRILFLFPEYIGESDVDELNCSPKVWSYNYKTGGWSFLEASYTLANGIKDYNYYFSSISSSMLYEGASEWNDEIALDPVGLDNPSTINTWDTWKANYATWTSLKDGELSDQTLLFGLLFRDEATQVLTTQFYIEMNTGYNDVLGVSQSSSPVTKSMESADYDFGIPDDNKQINRFSLKVQEHVSENTYFDVWVSNNRGKTYKPIGGLYIKADEDEGKINFRSKGSTFRFKFESTDLNKTTINEMVIRLSKRGEEN